MEDTKDLIEDGASNERFISLGKLLGLEIFEIAGICYTPLENASNTLGFTPPEFKTLLDRYQFIVCKEVDGRIFVPYRGILFGGMEGKTEAANTIIQYLLAAERTVRLSNAINPIKTIGLLHQAYS